MWHLVVRMENGAHVTVCGRLIVGGVETDEPYQQACAECWLSNTVYACGVMEEVIES